MNSIKKFLILASLLISSYTYAELPQSPKQIEDKDGIVYALQSDELFTGEVIFYSHDNKPLYLIYDHDFSHRVMNYRDGKLESSSYYYDEGGNKVLCEVYEEGELEFQWSCLGC